MSRLTIILTAAAASALAAAAIVALPALGDDSPDTSPAALAACLRSHGLDGAPNDAAALKPWIAQRQEQDPAAVKRAMNACQEHQSGPKKPRFAERDELSTADVAKLVACMRDNGLAAPSDPAALKRWFEQQKASGDPAAFDNAARKCKMALAPAAAKPVDPSACGDGAGAPGEPAAKPDEPDAKG
jgi:cytochrome c553